MAASVWVRPARSGEAAALTGLAVRSKAHWGYDTEFLARALPDLTVDPDGIDAGMVLVAEDGDGVAGFAGLEQARPGVFDVSGFFVAPERIGTGIGRILFLAMAAHARRQRTSQEPASVLTIVSDPNAEEFYLRMGAIRVGEELVAVTGRSLPLLSYAL